MYIYRSLKYELFALKPSIAFFKLFFIFDYDQLRQFQYIVYIFLINI